MRIIEQYITAIRAFLPLKGRADITNELRSLLLDEIEGTYGKTPSEDDVKNAIKSFGNPFEVASRYKNKLPVIAEGLKEFYFLIIIILTGAMGIVFTIATIVDCIEKNLKPKSDADQGLKIVKMIEAAQESLNNGGIPVTL